MRPECGGLSRAAPTCRARGFRAPGLATRPVESREARGQLGRRRGSPTDRRSTADRRGGECPRRRPCGLQPQSRGRRRLKLAPPQPRLRPWRGCGAALVRGESAIAPIGITLAAIFLGTMAAAGWWTLRTQKAASETARAEQVTAVANLLAHSVEPLLAQDELSAVRRLVAEAGHSYGLSRCRIVLPGRAGRRRRRRPEDRHAPPPRHLAHEPHPAGRQPPPAAQPGTGRPGPAAERGRPRHGRAAGRGHRVAPDLDVLGNANGHGDDRRVRDDRAAAGLPADAVAAAGRRRDPRGPAVCARRASRRPSNLVLSPDPRARGPVLERPDGARSSRPADRASSSRCARLAGPPPPGQGRPRRRLRRDEPGPAARRRAERGSSTPTAPPRRSSGPTGALLVGAEVERFLQVPKVLEAVREFAAGGTLRRRVVIDVEQARIRGARANAPRPAAAVPTTPRRPACCGSASARSAARTPPRRWSSSTTSPSRRPPRRPATRSSPRRRTSCAPR